MVSVAFMIGATLMIYTTFISEKTAVVDTPHAKHNEHSAHKANLWKQNLIYVLHFKFKR